MRADSKESILYSELIAMKCLVRAFCRVRETFSTTDGSQVKVYAVSVRDAGRELTTEHETYACKNRDVVTKEHDESEEHVKYAPEKPVVQVEGSQHHLIDPRPTLVTQQREFHGRDEDSHDEHICSHSAILPKECNKSHDGYVCSAPCSYLLPQTNKLHSFERYLMHLHCDRDANSALA